MEELTILKEGIGIGKEVTKLGNAVNSSLKLIKKAKDQFFARSLHQKLRGCIDQLRSWENAGSLTEWTEAFSRWSDNGWGRRARIGRRVGLSYFLIDVAVPKSSAFIS